MVHVKNYETVSKFVMQRKLYSFFQTRCKYSLIDGRREGETEDCFPVITLSNDELRDVSYLTLPYLRSGCLQADTQRLGHSTGSMCNPDRPQGR